MHGKKIKTSIKCKICYLTKPDVDYHSLKLLNNIQYTLVVKVSYI